ncbi:MAG: glycosyltransferase [Bacteroidetes bacterium]|nr:MAG: glycosyltransferase [Bacteroidota bacterium]
MIILQIIFWISLILIIHSYLVFPLILERLARKKRIHRKKYTDDELPVISVLIAAYNEEDVIEAKIRSVLASNYPAGRMEILVGSDASTDRTDGILQNLEKQFSGLRVFIFDNRTGKPGVVNRLVRESAGEVLVITDANVLLDRETIREMVSMFAEPRTGLVDSRMISTNLKKEGISLQEKFYISREVKIKYNESLVWGTMMGPFGGCYSVRKSLFTPVPSNFLVDDFFINMSVLRQGYHCISNIDARVYEDVSNDLSEEFRRKKRISSGNFQNLARFASLLGSRKPGIAFCFFSHKVIRWIVPFLVMITLGTSLALSGRFIFYRILTFIQLGILVIPVFDFFLRKNQIHAVPLRFISHFVLMNLALLAGFIGYAGGIENNVWEPTRRNQL